MSLTETTKPPMASGQTEPSTIRICVDGHTIAVNAGELVVEAILREKEIPHICYHSPLMGPIQTCDTCLVEIDGKLLRSCGTKVNPGMQVITDSQRAKDARAEAFDVILGNHMLYCTVCDNNNENCRVHNTALALNVQHQEQPARFPGHQGARHDPGPRQTGVPAAFLARRPHQRPHRLTGRSGHQHSGIQRGGGED